MATRSPALQAFVDAAAVAFEHAAQTPEASRAVSRIFAALQAPGAVRIGPGSRRPVCSHLPAALNVEIDQEPLRRLVDSFRELEPSLEWSLRSDATGTGSENFSEGHANTMVIGPAGLEHRTDVWLGASLLAPDVRYPDHNHAPEEVYLVASQGEFRHGESDWFSPGIGGSFYNLPNIRHAMRSGDKPLFAFWALLSDRRP